MAESLMSQNGKTIVNVVKRKSSEDPGSPPATSAFGDDVADHHFNNLVPAAKEDKQKGAQNGEVSDLPKNFGKATFSKSPPGMEKIRPPLDKRFSRTSTSSDKDPDRDSTDQSTDQSTEQSSDEPTTSSQESTDIDMVASGWAQFAQTRFQVKGAHSYCCAALPQPLLPKKDKADHLAALASWVTVLRIMGDLPEMDFGESIAVAGLATPAITRVRSWYGKKYTKKEVDDAHRAYTELFKDPTSETQGIPFLPENKESMLEKVQYVCALGIYKPEIRDELYCQVCRQLTNNPSRNSTVRGWVLLTLFAGSFAPTEKFSLSFIKFLRDGPAELANRVERMLRRTFVIGTRGYPPSWLEFQAAKNGKPILLPVALMSGQRMLVQADSASTVQELVTQLTHRFGLLGNSGFSIYITLMQRISCLGHGQHRIMDAVAECEQFTKQMGMRESSSTWRLYFRKEYFTPWHDPRQDQVATDIIYQQIMRGISVGEYKCGKEEVLVLMAAQRYFLEFPDSLDVQKLQTFLKGWLPQEQQREKEMSHWTEQVKSAFQNNFQTQKSDPVSLKADIVTFAKDKWFLLFSRFYDATKIQGPGVSWANVIMGVNCNGVYVMGEDESIKTNLSFTEITTVTRGRHTVTINTVQGDEYSVNSPHSEDLYIMLMSFMDGLKRRSKYAVVLHDSANMEMVIEISVARGDLVILDKPFEDYMGEDIFAGSCKRTGKHGSMPRDLVYILPTSEEPTPNIMGMLAVQLRKDVGILPQNTIAKSEECTLQQYAKLHFRQTTDNTVTKLLNKASFKRKEQPGLWQHSKEPLKRALLRRTSTREDLRRVVCRSFLAVQQYMGDAPNKEQVPAVTLVNDYIIEPALRSRHLRDEVYCQVLKQLTLNPDRSSEEKGWRLLWLLCTCIVPGSDLFEECERYLKASKNRLASVCLLRLQTTKLQGCRMYPPHLKEHEAISDRQTKVNIEIRFPDNTQEVIELESCSRSADVRRHIADKLRLQSPDEYGVFFGLRDRVICATDDEYFFDSLTHAETYWASQAAASKSSHSFWTERDKTTTTPLVIFMKKLWINASPGADKVADVMFHFSQEVPNFLRGYHRCSPEDAAKLGAHVYRARYGNDRKPLEKFKDIGHSLLPRTLLPSMPVEEWEKSLTKYLAQLSTISQDDAKCEFLKILNQWPTFGSVFFEVKQRSLKQYGKHMIVAVNVNGVMLINPSTRNVLETHSFNKIPNWAYDDHSFTFVLGDSSGSSKLFLETTVGHNMDDIVMAYVAWNMNSQVRKRPGYTGATIGESRC